MVRGHSKRSALVFVGIALAAMLLLASAFHNLDVSPEWHPLPLSQRAEPESTAAPEPGGITIPADLYAAILILSLVLMVATVVVGLISPRTRKRTLGYLLLITVLLVVLLVANSPPEDLTPVAPEPSRAPPFEGVEVPAGAEGTAIPGPEIAAEGPSWMGWGIAAGLALLIAGGLVAGGWFVWRATHPPASTLEQFAQEAQGAIDALRAGADPRDTVMRCYLEMSRVLRQERGISRNQAMTPREFEASLEQAGLPNERIRQLTRLFETVRYGARAPGGEQGRQAIDCLSAIVQACRSTS